MRGVNAVPTVMNGLHATFCPDLCREEAVDQITILAGGILRDDPDCLWHIAHGTDVFTPNGRIVYVRGFQRGGPPP